VFILDSLLVGSIRFVLDKVAAAVDNELHNADHLREELLAAEMRLELGEITEEEFAEIETSLLARMRELREEREGPGATTTDGYKVTGVEATFGGDEEE
jgi:hypothetical protein